MTIFWSRSLKGVHGTWKTPGFAFLAPLLVELQPTLGVIFGIIAVFRGPQRGTWGPHGRPLALSLPFGMSRPGLAPIWSQFNPRSQPRGGPKTVKIVICDKTPFFPNRPFSAPGTAPRRPQGTGRHQRTDRATQVGFGPNLTTTFYQTPTTASILYRLCVPLCCCLVAVVCESPRGPRTSALSRHDRRPPLWALWSRIELLFVTVLPPCPIFPLQNIPVLVVLLLTLPWEQVVAAQMPL